MRPAHAPETGDVLEGINTFARSYTRDGTPTSGVVQLEDWLGLDITDWIIGDTVCTFDPTSEKFYFGFFSGPVRFLRKRVRERVVCPRRLAYQQPG